MKKDSEQIEVRIVYPSAQHPAEREFAPEATLRQVKQFALDEFGLKEETVDGNQIVFFLFLNRTKVENLDQLLSGVVEKPNDKATFRLAKEVIAGKGMDPLQSRISLQADLNKISEERASNGWAIESWPLTMTTFLVTMKSDIDGEPYTLRLDCDGYPDVPPSIKCVDPASKEPNTPRAWPRCEGFRPVSDLCMSISREGLLQLHPGWNEDPRYRWQSTGNPIWYVLSSIQDRLNDRSKYHGRNQ